MDFPVQVFFKKNTVTKTIHFSQENTSVIFSPLLEFHYQKADALRKLAVFHHIF